MQKETNFGYSARLPARFLLGCVVYETLTPSMLHVYARGSLLKIKDRSGTHEQTALRPAAGFVCRSGVAVANSFDLRWLLLFPAALAVCFLVWVLVSFSRDRTRGRTRSRTPQRGNNGIWE